MSTKEFTKITNRQKVKPFFAFPISILRHPNFANLSARGARLICDMADQIRIKNGRPCNNGDLCATFSIMQKRGWKSKTTLSNAIKELLYYEFIVLTRKGKKTSAKSIWFRILRDKLVQR